MRILTPGPQIVKKANKPPLALVSCGDCLAGARLQGSRSYRLLQITQHHCDWKVDLDGLQGSYTTILSNGYTLPLSVRKASFRAPIRGAAACKAGVAAGRGGPLPCRPRRNGLRRSRWALHRRGVTPLDRDWPTTGFLMSTSNAESAIGWHLER